MDQKENDDEEDHHEKSKNPNATVLGETLMGADLNNYRVISYQEKAPVAPEGLCGSEEVSLCSCHSFMFSSTELSLYLYHILNTIGKFVILFCFSGHANNLKVLYSSSKHPSSVSKKSTRHIPTQPEKILDAPDIRNDYYLQLCDWSSSNILAVALNREIYLWNSDTGDIVNLLELPEDEYVSSVSWIEDGNCLAVGTSAAEVQLWDADKMKRLRVMTGHTGRVASLDWNAHILSSGSRSGYIHHHDVRVAQHHVGTLSGHAQEVCGLKWSPGGQYLASGGNDNAVRIWPNVMTRDVENIQPVYTFTDHQAAVKVSH